MEIQNDKLYALLSEKDELVRKGRKVSAKVEITNLKIEKNKDKQRKYTEELEPTELIAKGNELSKVIEANLTALENIQKEVHTLKIQNIPADVATEYENLKKELESHELERNKLALKVQKIKDRSVPLIQKAVKPFLKEYEDIESAELKNGKIVVKIFSHLEEWKQKFAEKNK